MRQERVFAEAEAEAEAQAEAQAGAESGAGAEAEAEAQAEAESGAESGAEAKSPNQVERLTQIRHGPLSTTCSVTDTVAPVAVIVVPEINTLRTALAAPFPICIRTRIGDPAKTPPWTRARLHAPEAFTNTTVTPLMGMVVLAYSSISFGFGICAMQAGHAGQLG